MNLTDQASSEVAEIRKVGVHIKAPDNSNDCILLKMDITRSIQETVAHLCLDCGIPYERGRLGLWRKDETVDGTRYITDVNKWKIQNGLILVLKDSPEIVADELYKKLFEEGADSLKKIAKVSEDVIILKELCSHKSVYKKVIDLCLEINDDYTWCYGLKIILNMLNGKIVKRINSEIVKQLTWIIEHHKLVSKELLLICMEMLMFIRRHKRLRYESDLFANLHEILQREESRDLQEAALKLMNYLVYFPNDLDEEHKAMQNVVNSEVVSTICEKVLMSHGPLTKVMQQQLYKYQCLTFRRYWIKKVTKIPKSDPSFKAILDNTLSAKKDAVKLRKASKVEASEPAHSSQQPSSLFRNLRASFRMSRQDFTSSRFVRALSPPRRERTSSSIFYTKENKPFSFGFYGPVHKVAAEENKCTGNSSKEDSVAISKSSSLSSIPDKMYDESVAGSDTASCKWNVSLLTVENLQFLAENDPEMYQKWSFHKGQRYLFADKITQMLCRLLEVGRSRPFDTPCDNYHPIAFHTYPYFLEELFCEALAQYEITSKEMKARVESDEPKVIAILQQQMEYALGSKSQTMENFKLVLSGTAYEVVAEKKWAEARERFRHDLQHKPIYLEFREQCKPKILEMIQQNRLNFMKKGQKLPRINNKGDIQKTISDRVYLSKSGDSIVIRNVAKIQVSDILDIEIGKSSNFYREIRKYQDEHDAGLFFKTWQNEQEFWSLLFSLKMSNNTYINLCAKSEQDLHYWQDGIHHILKKPMKSDTFHKELQMLLDMDVRLHFLEAEGLPIPDMAPEVPPPPTNYDFCYRRNLPLLQTKQKLKFEVQT